MHLIESHPLKDMERVPAEELPDRLDALLRRMDLENVGFVLTEAGRDSLVLCPRRWFKPAYETVEIQVDSIVLEQLKELVGPMGLTPEDLVVQFFRWCVNPDTREEAISWLKRAKEECESV